VKCRSLCAASAAIAVIAAGGCGGSGHGASRAAVATAAAAPSVSSTPAGGEDAIRLLGSESAPADWPLARGSGGAALPYPPGWQRLGGDRGTLSAALRDGAGRYLGYLNLTPRQGAERASNWRSFRPAHNRAEGDRDVRVLSFARGVRLRAGIAACVQDAYTTSTATRYVEVACLLDGPNAAVVLGAAPAGGWRSQAPSIARALSAVTL
jgi:hypothetical protein